MSKTPSSVAWLNSKYSRAKGQIARATERIRGIEAKLELHRHNVQRGEEQLRELKGTLARSEARASQYARALELHARAPRIEAVGKILPNEHPPFFKHGGMTTAIFRALRSAPTGAVTIDELQSQLMQTLDLAPKDSARFRIRLQTRLQVMLREGKVSSPDPNGAPAKRWMMAKDWAPTPRAAKRKKYPTHISHGVIQPARWLIQSQLDITVAKNGSAARDEASLSAKLGQDMDVIDGIWRQHPFHFEVDLGWTPSSRTSHYRESIYARVSRILTQAPQGMTITALQAACPCPSSKNRRASTRAIEAALRQMLLEGRVEHRQSKRDGHVEWRLIVTQANQ